MSRAIKKVKKKIQLHTKLKKITPEMLLAIGGAIIFFVFGTGMVISHLVAAQPVVEVDPSLIGKSDFEKGQYYFNSGDDPSGAYDLAKAQYFYERAIAKNPSGNNLEWYQSGRIDFINGNFDVALSKFDKQIQYYGESVPNVYYMIGLVYGYKARSTNNPEDWKRGEDAFLRFIELVPKAPWPRVDLAWIYFSQGKYEEMKPLLEEGLSHDSNNPWLMNMYGLALFNTGDTEMAREYFKFALEITDKMTVEQWGRSYPGNNPQSWGQGLSEFKEIIKKNVDLTQE